MTTVRRKIKAVLDDDDYMTSEEIFITIRENLDHNVRMITVSRVLYDMMKDDEVIRDGNKYLLKCNNIGLRW